MSEDDLFLPIVTAGIELEFRILLLIENRPSGKSACDGDDVLLCVASIYAQRVELHQLARIVLVEAGSPGTRRQRQIVARHLRLPVVEIEQHCGMLSRRKKH